MAIAAWFASDDSVSTSPTAMARRGPAGDGERPDRRSTAAQWRGQDGLRDRSGRRNRPISSPPWPPERSNADSGPLVARRTGPRPARPAPAAPRSPPSRLRALSTVAPRMASRSASDAIASDTLWSALAVAARASTSALRARERCGQAVHPAERQEAKIAARMPTTRVTRIVSNGNGRYGSRIESLRSSMTSDDQREGHREPASRAKISPRTREHRRFGPVRATAPW